MHYLPYYWFVSLPPITTLLKRSDAIIHLDEFQEAHRFHAISTAIPNSQQTGFTGPFQASATRSGKKSTLIETTNISII